MSQHFTHLHLHTDFSLLDGAISIDKLIAYGKEHNFKSLAITDHGNIFGAVKFFHAAKKAGIKPIIGMEAYFTEDVSIKNVEKKYYHLILLVQNETGYKNLCKLIAYSYQKGFYFKPRIDYEILEKHSEGLIVTSACLGGHIPQLLMKEKFTEAEEKIDWFLRVFGPERFYFEVQPEDQDEQKILNAHLYEWSKKKGISVVAAGDCHYVSPEDREAHEVMLSIQTRGKITDPNRYSFGEARVPIRSQQEMLELFKGHEEVVWNSGKIADMCSFEFQTDKLFFPKFDIPEGKTPETHFQTLCQEGLKQLKDANRLDKDLLEKYADRLELEMNLIIKMGFVGYFLVVSDFIQWARNNKIPVGPGRGSAAGSLVAWTLRITDVDPIKYNLLFERFLNPERVSMPDIDIDFCIEGREKVIEYVRNHYGHENVCQIITFGTMLAKGVIKDVARVLGFPFADANAITELIPDQLKISLKEAREQEPRLQELIDSNPRVEKLFNIALKLEGLTRHASKHAAGVVISPEPVDGVLPIYVPPKSTELVAQYAMAELESIGFLKIDLLGLKNLTLVDRALDLIEKHHNLQPDINHLPLDDTKTFELLRDGKTSGVFQLESSGLKDVLRRLQPDKFEDIIAVNALYRPGPLGSGMVDDFIERRHGRQKITYLFPELAPILEETYGVIVYQEQVMKIASAIGGYSLGSADILRRAMGKKKAEVMAEQRELFLEGAQKNNFDAKKAGELFDLMAYFAGYGFNKSHSAAYAFIAYQTAYLKANYPAEFMASLISLEAEHNTEAMANYVHEAKEMGIDVLQPDINQSQIAFSVIEKNILFGLRGVKNVGYASLENLLEERKKRPFSDLLDFCERIDLRTTNKRVIESFICAGAFDFLPGNRSQKFDELPKIIDLALERKQALKTGQMGLFDQTTKKRNKDDIPHAYEFTPKQEWPDKLKLEKEKDVVGLYVSAQPLDSYKKQLAALNTLTFTQALDALQTAKNKEPIVTVCGLLTSSKIINTKKGDRMAFVQIEDTTTSAELIVFPKLFAKSEEYFSKYNVFIVRGSVDAASIHNLKIKANQIIPLDLMFENGTGIDKISLELPQQFNEDFAKNLQKTFINGQTNLELIFEENNQKIRLLPRQPVLFNEATFSTLEKQGVKVSLRL